MTSKNAETWVALLAENNRLGNDAGGNVCNGSLTCP
jgi:hypothetical protein